MGSCRRAPRLTVGGFFKYLILIVLVATNILPFLWVILSSFKGNDEIYTRSFSLPRVYRLENYRNALGRAGIAVGFLNSVVIASLSVLTVLLVSSMAAYILARIWSSLALYSYYALGIMIPIHSVLIPSFIIIRRLGLVNTRIGIMLLFIAGSISVAVFILVGFMKGIPRELEQAAAIDGSGYVRTFFQIILPVAKPGLATVATLAFLNMWNDYLFSTIILVSREVKTITLAVFDLRHQFSTDYGLVTAGLVMAIIPVTVLYIVFQEWVVRGMVAGAVKG